jgi:hypothetical protein
MEEAMERVGSKILDLLGDELLITDEQMGPGITVLATIIGSLAACVEDPNKVIEAALGIAKEVASGEMDKVLHS